MLGGGAVAPLPTPKKEGYSMKAEINKEWCYQVIIREIYNQGMNCKEFAQQINVDRKILIASPNNQKKVRCEQMEEFKVKKILKAEAGKLSTVLEYSSGARVEIPINLDGTVKWFDDSKLIKSEKCN